MADRVLVTGAFGQIGTELVPAVQKLYGTDNVYCLDKASQPSWYCGRVFSFDIRDRTELEKIIKDNHITVIYHLVSLLSATGEKDPQAAWDVNMNGLKSILDLSVQYKVRVFWPSSIAVFGPTAPRDNTPQYSPLTPSTMYGVTKVSGELLCQYYRRKYDLDVRSLRYPGLISYTAPPGGGTTDYAVAIFHEALKNGKYDCFLSPETVLPMMYMEDAIRATLELMSADPGKLAALSSYNISALSFSAEELAAEIARQIPLQVTYTPDYRQAIADSWPRSVDDSAARSDWGWQPKYDLALMVETMLKNLRSLG